MNLEERPPQARPAHAAHGGPLPEDERALPWRQRFMARWNAAELRLVGAQRRIGALPLMCSVAAITNWLGNGWLYLLLALLLLIDGTATAHNALLKAGLAAGLSHAVYPWVKRRVARRRPYEKSPLWFPSTPAMDRYSFPSGHCMTATAVALPLSQAYPGLAWVALVFVLGLAWARMACAHHYLSDLLGGLALGAGAAYAAGLMAG